MRALRPFHERERALGTEGPLRRKPRNSRDDDEPLAGGRGRAVADIFVSYTSKDRGWAFWIGKELKQLGHRRAYS